MKKQDPLDRLTGARRAMQEQRKEGPTQEPAQSTGPKDEQAKPSEPKRVAGRTRH